MKKYIQNTIFLIILSAFIVGCATTANGPSFSDSKAPTLSEGKSTIYVYRDYAEPTAWGCTIFVNENEATQLNQKGFTWFKVQPGTYSIKGKWSGLSGQKESKIDLEIEENKTYYIELTGISKVTGIVGPAMIFKMGSGLHLLSPEVALKKLEDCSFQPPIFEEYE